MARYHELTVNPLAGLSAAGVDASLTACSLPLRNARLNGLLGDPAAGTDVDYEGATAVELIGPGESAGRYRQFEVKGGKNETVGFR